MSVLSQSKPVIPAWLIWIQCVAFVVLYAVWILPQIVGLRNTALVVGALAGLFPIYQYRDRFLQKRAVPIWLIGGLFVWASFHLLFLSHDYVVQLLEYKRIWRYAAIAAIFALGLGLSLANATSFALAGRAQIQAAPYWGFIFFGLCTPVLIYLLKYFLTVYGSGWGIQSPDYLLIATWSDRFYIPKTDYVAFCLPPMAIALGRVQFLITYSGDLKVRQALGLFFYAGVIFATLFLFYAQDIKNGIAYAALCIALFSTILIVGRSVNYRWQKFSVVAIILAFLVGALHLHVQKNDSWKSLLADVRIGLQTDVYEQWKYAGEKGYPNNEFGKMVSITNYDRAAWFKVGVQLVRQVPLGYGLIEDSFKKIVKVRWPEASSKLSHSHSGWLDFMLGFGLPGFLCLFGALIWLLWATGSVNKVWRGVIFWSLFSNCVLWVTTEVSANVTFSALIFWVCFASGLSIFANEGSMNSIDS